jgi:hypothetical protein
LRRALRCRTILTSTLPLRGLFSDRDKDVVITMATKATQARSMHITPMIITIPRV